MEKRIAYYEFPNGQIVKSVQGDKVYRYNPAANSWEPDHSLTAEFAWDRPYGEPCENLRKKADISCDLPPFPSEKEFFPGNTVLIGAYPQNSAHDFSPIPWLVLETTAGSALCITRDCIITSGYCDPRTAYGKPEMIRWENSLAREVCNQHFWDNAFSAHEKARMTARRTSASQPGKECADYVFLLSEQEVLEYFPTAAQRKAKPTAYALQKGARRGWTDDTRDCTSWWLLPEKAAAGIEFYPKAVFQMGEIQYHGRNAYHTDFTIRPCIEIRYK